MAGALGEPGFVGRVDARAAERDGVPKHRTSKRLRRLRQVDRLSGQRLHDGRRRGIRRHSLDGIGDRHGRDRGTVVGGGGNRAGDQVCGDEGARGIVDQHDVGLFPYQLECARDRILPAPAACDIPNRSCDLANDRPGTVHQVYRQRHDHLVHLRMAVERADAAREHRLPGKIEQLLGNRGTEAPAGAACGDDGCHTHAQDSLQSTVGSRQSQSTVTVNSRSLESAVGRRSQQSAVSGRQSQSTVAVWSRRPSQLIDDCDSRLTTATDDYD